MKRKRKIKLYGYENFRKWEQKKVDKLFEIKQSIFLWGIVIGILLTMVSFILSPYGQIWIYDMRRIIYNL